MVRASPAGLPCFLGQALARTLGPERGGQDAVVLGAGVLFPARLRAATRRAGGPARQDRPGRAQRLPEGRRHGGAEDRPAPRHGGRIETAARRGDGHGLGRALRSARRRRQSHPARGGGRHPPQRRRPLAAHGPGRPVRTPGFPSSGARRLRAAPQAPHRGDGQPFPQAHGLRHPGRRPHRADLLPRNEGFHAQRGPGVPLPAQHRPARLRDDRHP